MQRAKISTSWGPSRANSLTPPCRRRDDGRRGVVERVISGRQRLPSFSTRCWQGPTTTSGPCWCASTYRCMGYGTLSSQRKEKQSSTGRIGWRSPPYYDLCAPRDVGISLHQAEERSPLRTANPSMIFQCESRGSPTTSPHSVAASMRQKSWRRCCRSSPITSSKLQFQSRHCLTWMT